MSSKIEAKVGERVTLWALLCQIMSLLVWFGVVVLIWFTFSTYLVLFGFRNVPDNTWYFLVTFVFVAAFPITASIRWQFGRFREWAMSIELPDWV